MGLKARSPAKRRDGGAVLLKERAYAVFKKRLFAGEIKPGQFVSQRELAAVIGLPIGPVRDALKRLQAEALVRVIPQRGIQIADVNARLIRDAYELRTALEVHATRQYVRSGDAAVMVALDEEMRGILARLDANGFTEDLARDFIRADFALHERLIAALDNAIVADVYRVNTDRMLLIRLTNRLNRERLVAAATEHLAIFDALRRGDGDAAALAMARHLQAAFQRMMGLA